MERQETKFRPSFHALKVREMSPVEVNFRDAKIVGRELNDGIEVRFRCVRKHEYVVYDKVTRRNIGWMRKI